MSTNIRSYPQGTFVTITLGPPHHGRIVIQDEDQRRSRVLWECTHDHPTGPEAAACAGDEIGRTRRT